MITGSVQPKNGKLYLVINLYDENGKRCPKWKSTGLPERGNKRLAEKMLAETLADYNKQGAIYCNISVADYFSHWITTVKSEVRQNTYRNYLGNMKNHIIPYFRAKRIALQDLRASHIEAYYNSKLQGTLSKTTIKHHHQNIGRALADAVRLGLIPTNPATAARTPKPDKYVANFLNPTEINKLIALFENTVIKIPVALCAVYGFRRSEVLGLKWGKVDFEKRTLTIAETLQQNTGGDYTDTPKTDCSYRTLPMTKSIYNLLLEHKTAQEQHKETLGKSYIASDYVCTWDNGAVIAPNYLTKKFHDVVYASDLPKIRLHDLRHSVASNLLSQRFSPVQVQEWLGHESAATTLRFYAHVDDSSKLNIAKALQNTINI